MLHIGPLTLHTQKYKNSAVSWLSPSALLQAVTLSDLNIRTYAGKKIHFSSCWCNATKKTAAEKLHNGFLSLSSVGVRNHAATDPSCHSNKLLQQVDEGGCQSYVPCPCADEVICEHWCVVWTLSPLWFQRWPTVQDLATATLEVSL